ncbi:arsenate reductase family protein [Acetonema longum]|uniref:Uncharacterized protein n=1 Tax=Acetonema longum DSM 6540 TaxID=1009370 RepID=F7NGD3_9FIRM|nr:hypothetical protein ALO_05585 [Acetonema longum DSM 6540]
MLTFICYPKCTTCQRAQAWLDARGAKYRVRNIKTENPTYEELEGWHTKSGLPLGKFFNTSGLVYKSLHLKNELPSMSTEEQLRLLAKDGMLVKRPLLIAEAFVLVGFKETDWAESIAFNAQLK